LQDAVKLGTGCPASVRHPRRVYPIGDDIPVMLIDEARVDA
jgi:uncharacterized protein YbaR (Trm112 family)